LIINKKRKEIPMKNKKSKVRLRPASKHFFEQTEDGRNIVKQVFVIESLSERKWLMIGDENGITKYETREARDKAMKELEDQFRKQGDLV